MVVRNGGLITLDFFGKLIPVVWKEATKQEHTVFSAYPKSNTHVLLPPIDPLMQVPCAKVCQ